nr:putative ribonuclease H-like domain-containing protein [Tanacetum cinerariifolium]
MKDENRTRLAKKNELKARGTLLMALPDKHQLKFNIHKDAKTLMEAIEKSTNEPVSAVANVSAASAKIHVSAVPNVDTLKEMDLKWQMAMLTVRARRFLQRTRRNLGENGPTSMGSDMSKMEYYNCHRKGHFARECRLPNDTRKNVIAEPQRRNILVETYTSNALVSQCDGVGSYEWSFQAEEEPTNYALMAFTSSSSSSFDNEVVSYSKACTKAYATLQSHYDKLVDDFRKSQSDVISYKTGLESVEARLLVYQQNKTVFEEDIKLLKLEVQLRDNALVVLQQKFEKAKQERDDLKLKLEKFQTSCKNLSQLLATQTNDKTGLGYNTYVFTTFMFDFDEMFTFKTDDSLPVSPKYDRPSTPIIEDWVSDSEDDSKAEIPQNALSFVQPNKQVKTPRPSFKIIETFILTANPKTTTPKPKSHENSRNRKVCFVCKSLTYLIKDCNYYAQKMAQTHTRNHAQRGNHQQYARMTLLNPQRHVASTSVLTKSKLVPITAARPVTAAAPKPHVTRPRQAKTIVTKPHSPPRRHINRSPSPKASNFPPKVTAVKVPQGNPHHALKDKGVIDSGCSRNMTGNMSYLSDFEEINSRYVAFGGNPKGGKISGKGKIRTGKLDFDDVYFVKELMENNMYNVDLKNIVLSRDLTCLFAKATLDESNLWHRRLGHINFKTINKLVKGKFDGNVDEGFLVGYSISSSSPTWLFDIDTITKTMNYQPVTTSNQSNPSAGVQEQFDAEKAREENVQQYVLFPIWSSGFKSPQNINGDAAFEVKEHEFEGRKPESEVHVFLSGYRNLSAEFEDFSDNIINEVNADDSLVPAVKQILNNSTNTFSVVGPSNTVVSLTHGKSSYVDTSQYPDDPNMPELEDITYFDDEEDVGAEADFTNLETTITVSLIPTTIVHKDHPVRQIIGDLSSATQTRNYASFMGFMVYQMDVKSAFLYGTIKEEVYVCQPLGFEDPDYLNKVYKVVKALYGLHQAPRAWYETLANYLLENGFQKGKIDQTLFIKRQKGDILLVQMYVDDIIFGLQVKQKKDGIFISQDKYIAEILSKFGLTDVKSASTPIDTNKPLLKDPDGEDVDVHTYRSMIGSLMHLTSSRPDIMFAVCACARFQVTPKFSHLHAVKRIFRYLKGKPHLGLWYHNDSPFNLVSYSDSDYAGASLDRKSTTGRGCQFLGCRLISWQCKKQTVVANSSTEAEYVAATSFCAQVLWIQNQLLDYGPDQTVSGKDSSNPLMADNLPKIMVNDVTRLQALVDKKKVIITEAIIREALRLDDAESTDCLPNEEIFTELSRTGLVRNVDSSTKFYMYPRFLQLMIRAQVGDLSTIPSESYEFEGEIIPCSDFRLGTS